MLTLVALVGCTPPQNIASQVRSHNVVEDWEKLFCNTGLPEGQLTLCQAVELALERNFELSVQRQQRKLQHEFATSETLKMLPNLTTNTLVSERNNNPASSSQSTTGNFAALTTPSSSQERQQKTASLELAFGLLDFGVSYYRSRQEHNQTCVLNQQHIRLRQNIVRNVVDSYWKTQVLDYARKRAKELIEGAELRQASLQQRTEQGTVSKLVGLKSEQDLIEMQLKLNQFTSDYHSARAELAGLLGLPGDAPLKLVAIELTPIKTYDFDVRKLEKVALLCRPEVYEEDHKEQIAADEVRAAFLQLFPNVRLFANYNYDDTRFLLHNQWFDAGLRTTWDLLRFPTQYHAYRSTILQRKVAEELRLYVSMGIITQVHLAYMSFLDAVAEYELVEQLYRVRWDLLAAAKKGEDLGSFRTADLHTLEVEALLAEVNAIRVYAKAQSSLEQLANALGQPLLFMEDEWLEDPSDMCLRTCKTQKEIVLSEEAIPTYDEFKES